MSKFFEDGITDCLLKSIMENPDVPHVCEASYEAELYVSMGHFDPATLSNNFDDVLIQFTQFVQQYKSKIPCKVITVGYDHIQPYKMYGNRDQSELIDYPEFNPEKSVYYLPPETEIVTWKTRFFHDAVNEMSRQGQGGVGVNWINDLSVSKLFTSLIHRPTKWHRKILLQLLNDRNAFRKGVVRVANDDKLWAAVLNGDLDHDTHFKDLTEVLIRNAPHIFSPFKYWDFDGPGWQIDPFYAEGLFDIVPETQHGISMLTQKSCQPILYRKPFCVIGNSYQNHLLKDLGFELFDEVFDYSTEVPNDNPRFYRYDNFYNHMDNMLKNMWDIDTSLTSLHTWEMKFRPKLDHNLGRYMEILFSDDYIPEELLENPDCGVMKLVNRSRLSALENPRFEKFVPLKFRIFD